MTPSLIFLIQAFVIIAVPTILRRVAGVKGIMPLVTTQIIIGIALGPSVFGKLAPDFFQIFASPAALSPLGGLAIVAVLIFGLISGLHVDPVVFSGKERAFWPVAIATIVCPMILGCLAGYWILASYPDELLPGASPVVFVTAVGICVSMIALPVLAAILEEMGLFGSRISHLALGVAGVNDIALFALLGILLTIAAAWHAGHGHVLLPVWLLTSAPAYLIVMIVFVRPVLARLVTARIDDGDEAMTTRGAVVIGAATIGSGLATELIGLHYIIGAFVVGAIMPASLHKPILDRLQVMTVALLLPFFFTLTGMRTLIDLNSPLLLQVFSITMGVGVIGIIGGAALTARIFGETWSFGLALGSLLQAKGLTELVVLSVLLDAQIVSPRIFAAMILMAVTSTAISMPLARLALAKSESDVPHETRPNGNAIGEVRPP
jgi:Kef-type K+ transport system membrane component KefB